MYHIPVDVEDDDVAIYLLKRCSTLSWEEEQLIEYIRKHPEEKEEFTELLKK